MRLLAIRPRLREHPLRSSCGPVLHGALDFGLTAWVIVGFGTVANIGSEFGLLSTRAHKRLVGEVGRSLLGEKGA